MKKIKFLSRQRMATPEIQTPDDILPLDCKEIPKFVQQIALKELGETESKREKCLKELRTKISNERNLRCDASDNFLLRFVRARKFDTEAAFTLLKSHYKHRLKNPSVYQQWTPKQNMEMMKADAIGFLEKRNTDGSAIYFAKVGLWNPAELSFEQILRFGLICNEKAVDSEVTQICGITSIADMKDFSWSHLMYLPLTKLTCFVSAVQDCLPVRHKAIHIVNNPSIFAFVFALIKPLINKKLRDRIHFHGDNMSSLHEHVSPYVLPREYGGTLGTLQTEPFYSSLLDSEEEFLRRSKYGYEMQTD
ncbi:alpha-tocopherol transfer protein-like isoform X2 [Argiope bruennichi]|uniref:alpha-tocopherol transfer protein-like isoform X2 n=1 Tax=Argiope bruennichi TaxID=94029 RepID=UPI002494CF8A|nr:alpha-tocopherol transfer protein-like isoform X2 [Argiope bruennichi]